jgi:putative ABC transport system permease protein
VTATLGTFRTLLVIVSVVIMALVVYVLTMEKIRALATLKLIGAPNRIIVRLILEQSLVLAVLGFAVGYGLVIVGHTRFPRTLVFEPSDTIITFAVIFAGGGIASLFGIWRALKTPASVALGG